MFSVLLQDAITSQIRVVRTFVSFPTDGAYMYANFSTISGGVAPVSARCLPPVATHATDLGRDVTVPRVTPGSHVGGAL
jgi:hypothetical protein